LRMLLTSSKVVTFDQLGTQTGCNSDTPPTTEKATAQEVLCH
jgi:hypothetical protein